MSPGRISLIAWIVTTFLSFRFLGGFLGRRLEGQLPSTGDVIVLAFVGVGLLTSLVLTVRWARAPSATVGNERGIGTRRRFLLGVFGASGGIIATLGAAFFANRRWFTVTGENIFFVKPRYKADVVRDEWAGSRVASYRRLGRTEALVSDISLGSGAGTGGRQTEAVVLEAIERGITYFDTAPDYSEAGSEQRFGSAMKGKRDKIFVATKFCLPNGHLGRGASVEAYMEAVEGSLRRLQTDWVDLVHVHSCDSVERLMDENVHEAFDRLKAAGKVRFLGVSTHTPNLEEVANAAIESDRFDVMMLAYHFGAWPGLAKVIDRAAAKDIGVVGMKTLRGSKHHFLSWTPDERDSFTQASFKWVLSNPSVACLVISLWESAQLDEFLYASGKTPRPQDLAVLERYQELTTKDYCRPHCGACLDRCPKGLPIHDILRHRMYFEDYGAQKEGMRLYAALEKKADICSGCAAPCSSACPFGLVIPERLSEAHAMLTFGPKMRVS
ncbi:MAG: aldo/keto reductase [Deltaproteobacteria bacterium]|nr:aldo/keto reductase [Deltaproteobacteria bacterium]